MMKQRHRIVSSILAVTLAVLITAVFLPVNNIVFAAGGKLIIQLADIDGVGEDFPGFTFKMYKVGEFAGSNLKFDPAFADAKVTIPTEDKQEDWLKAASKLANIVKHPAEGQETAEPVKTFNDVKPGDSMTYDSSENALYLLIGETVRYDNAKYTPVAVLAGVFDEDNTFTIDAVVKMEITPIVLKHSVIKTWDDDENADGVRPDTIEVGIYYGTKLIDRITLGGDEGVWTYKWKSEETGDTYKYIGEKDGEEVEVIFKPDSGDKAWGVREFTKASEISDPDAKSEAKNLIYYEPEYEKSSSDTLELFKINNPYYPPDNPPDKPDTGDQNNLGLWVGIAGGACVLLALFALTRKKRKDEESNE